MRGVDPADAADLELLIRAARQAGDVACGFFRSDPTVWDKGGDAGPVTEADLAVNTRLDAELRGARPDYGWLSEETEDGSARLQTQRVFIIDPIDGTRAFIEGADHWAHSLAVVDDGVVVAGVVYLPVLDRLFAAVRGGGATCNGDAIAVSGRADLDSGQVLSNKANFRPEYWREGPPPVDRKFRSSLAYRLALVAEGQFDAMLTLRATWEWDVAAGSLIVTEAGGQACTASGDAPVFNRPSAALPGLIAGTPGTVRALMAYGPQLPTRARGN
ncbi:MAG: 3'(2'),5'-bisphosphate nucleotidase CysQ [Pseudomonadota bacterium]